MEEVLDSLFNRDVRGEIEAAGVIVLPRRQSENVGPRPPPGAARGHGSGYPKRHSCR